LRLLCVASITILGGALGYGSIRIADRLAAPRLELSATHLDLGTVSATQTVTGTVTLRNSGRAPLRIEATKASCGCTIAELGKHDFAPGEQADLKIKIVANSSLDPSATVAIASNDPTNPVQLITIKAHRPVVPVVTPSVLQFQGEGRADLPTTREVFVSADRFDIFAGGNRITATTPCGFLALSTDCETMPFKCRVEVRLLETSPRGHLQTTIHLSDQAGFVNDVVKVEAQIRSSHFLRQPPLIVARYGPEEDGPPTDGVTLRHRRGAAPDIQGLVFSTEIAGLLTADVVAQDSEVTRLRISHRVLPISHHVLPAMLDGYLAIHVAGEAAEEFRLPVTWCHSHDNEPANNHRSPHQIVP